MKEPDNDADDVSSCKLPTPQLSNIEETNFGHKCFGDNVGDNLGVGGVDGDGVGLGLGVGLGDVVGVHNINKKIKLAHFCNLAQSSVKMGNFVQQGLALLAVRLLLQEDAFHFPFSLFFRVGALAGWRILSFGYFAKSIVTDWRLLASFSSFSPIISLIVHL